MLLQKIATNTFFTVGLFSFFLFLGRNQLSFYGRGDKNWQDTSAGWAMLLMPPPGYMADHVIIILVKIAQFLSLLHVSTSFL